MIDKSSIEVLNGNFAKPMLPAGAVNLAGFLFENEKKI